MAAAGSVLDAHAVADSHAVAGARSLAGACSVADARSMVIQPRCSDGETAARACSPRATAIASSCSIDAGVLLTTCTRVMPLLGSATTSQAARLIAAGSGSPFDWRGGSAGRVK